MEEETVLTEIRMGIKLDPIRHQAVLIFTYKAQKRLLLFAGGGCGAT